MRRHYVFSMLFAIFVCSPEVMAARADVRTSVQETEPQPISLDAASVAKAHEWLERIRHGSIDRKQLDPTLSAMLTADFATGGAREVSAFALDLKKSR